MNTTYAKQKVEKLMAVANHPNTNPNEAKVAYNMAKKVAEKYKVFTWFAQTYPLNTKPTVEVTKKFYKLSELFRWTDIIHTMCGALANDMHFSYFGYSKRSGYYKNIVFNGTEDEFKFLEFAYDFILKSKNKYCKEYGMHNKAAHNDFTKLFILGYDAENFVPIWNYEMEAYKAGQELHQYYKNFRSQG